MTNFDFLQKDRLFQAFSDACVEAEKSISSSEVALFHRPRSHDAVQGQLLSAGVQPRFCGFGGR